MKVTCKNYEITGFHKRLEIEREGKIYHAELDYDEHNGYDLRFYDDKGEFIEWPEWADNYDNAMRSLDYKLDEATGRWEFTDPGEVEVAE